MRMPEPDSRLLAERDRILRGLRQILPADRLVVDENRMAAYDSDGLTVYRQLPYCVAIPDTLEEISEILRYCQDTGLKVVPRGSGTSLSGGALPLADGLLLSMARFSTIHAIDPFTRTARVGPGVMNAAISAAARVHGLHYAPDPSSQVVCSIGGNVAENSGGVHCLKYGLTTHNLMGLEGVLLSGEVFRLGGEWYDSDSFDLIGLLTGSEGLLAVITEVTVRLLPLPETSTVLLAGFDSEETAGEAVSRIICAGIIPAGLEMMDGMSVRAAESYVQAGYPCDVEALLICELDGLPAEVEDITGRVEALLHEGGATTVRRSRNAEDCERFWAGRKAAFPALGSMSPDYYCMDGTIPRRRLAETLRTIGELSRSYGLRVANVFHAGDGNLHPLILFDASKPDELHKAEQFGADILRLCVNMGGVLSGEHGIGVEKRDLMPLMFSEEELDQQQRIKCAFDPQGLLNPGKMFPRLRRCAELGFMHVKGGKLPFPDVPRF